jgi:hypothetical protein
MNEQERMRQQDRQRRDYDTVFEFLRHEGEMGSSDQVWAALKVVRAYKHHELDIDGG